MDGADRKRLFTVAVFIPLLGSLVPAPPLAASLRAPAAQRALELPGEPTSLRKVWRDLGRLRDVELVRRADELWGVAPDLTLEAMVLRAGAEVPPTVSTTRRGEREADRETALGWLREHLEDPEARDRWVVILRQLLSGTRTTTLACAAARTVGDLSEYRLAGEIVAGLGSPDGEVVQATRKALFTLYLRWFESREAFESSGAVAREVCDEDLHGVALEFERMARESRTKLLGYEPQRAAAALADPDPRMRAAAVAVLGRVGNGGTAEATARLLEHLGREFDGSAYLATIDALLQTLATAAPDTPGLRLLRDALRRTIEAGTVGLQAPAAQALPRLPWAETPDGPDSVMVGVDLLVGQLHQLTDPERLTDSDVLVASLKSLHTLGARADALGLPLAEHTGGLRETITRLIEDEGELEGVRVASARLLPLVGTSEDISRAVAVLDAPGSSPEFRYTLLGVLGDMSRELSSEDPGARQVLSTLLRRLTGEDINLRQRALSYLTDEGLEPLTRSAPPADFVDSLGRETVPELQAQLLDLITRYGSRAELESLISLPNFDAIANGGPAGISRVVLAMRQLADGDALLTVRGAARLLAVDNDSTRVLRLREVLGLIGGMDPVRAESIPPEFDQKIVRWATELRQAAGSVPGGEALPLLHRLVDVHIPGSEGAVGTSATELAHVQALFLSDLIALDPQAGEESEVLARFAEALTLAEQSNDAQRCALVRRDRARFHLARGEEGPALADFRALFAIELAPGGGGGASVLELGDLRRGGELLFAGATEDEVGKEVALEALRVSLALVNRTTWKREPAAVRAQDLFSLALRALQVDTLAAIDLALPIFAALPPLPPEPAEGAQPSALPAAPEGAAWEGLLDSREVHQRLLERCDRLRTRHVALAGAPPPGSGVGEEEGAASNEGGKSELPPPTGEG